MRFAHAGNRILYIENTGVRSPGLRDAGRVGLRLKRWVSASRSSGIREVAPNIFVCSPLVLPPFGSKLRRNINRKLLLSVVKRAAKRLRFRNPLLWTYLPTDTALDIIELLKSAESKLVYYCVADFTVLAANKELLRESERQLVESSDMIFATCPALVDHCSQWTNQPIHLFPSGVDLKAFPVSPDRPKPANRGNAELVEDLELLDNLLEKGEPLIGYIGGLHRFVDQTLIAEIARMRPDWNLVFIGPIQTGVEQISDLANVHLLGQRQHSILAYYLEKFTVCIIPYVNALETATVVPVKLKEYLAAEKPVISTELPAVVDFNTNFEIVALSKADPVEFVFAIEESVRTNSPELAKQRRKVAELSDWGSRIELMSQLIERSGVKDEILIQDRVSV